MRYLSLFFIFLCSFLCINLAYADDFAMTTTAFLDAGTLPVLYSCDGKDVSPQFSWTNAPEKTQSFALLMTDPEAPKGTWYHWIVYNIPNNINELSEGIQTLPKDAVVIKNSWDKERYNGPCPPKGSVHTYVFTLYALDKKLELPADADGKAVVDAMNGHILKEAKLTTVYSRWLK